MFDNNDDKDDTSLDHRPWHIITPYKSRNELQNSLYQRLANGPLNQWINHKDNKVHRTVDEILKDNDVHGTVDDILDDNIKDEIINKSNNESNNESNKASMVHRTADDGLKDNLNENNDLLDEKYKLMKYEDKRLKWNAYMRKYNANKRRELKERLDKVPIKFNNDVKLYNIDDINVIINNFINLFQQLYNINVEYFDESTTNAINSSVNDIVKYSNLLQNAIASILPN